MGEFEDYIEGTGLVEFAGWHFEKDECDEYLHEPTQIAAQIWREKESVINHQQSKIEQLEKEKKQVQNRFNFLLDKNICNESEHAALKLKYMEITRLVQGLRNEFNLWSDDGEGSDAIEAQIELLEEALRGAND